MKGVAIQYSRRGLYIDHLGVVATLFQIPFLFMDEDLCQLAKKYYPGIDARLVDYQDIFPSEICKNYTALFSSQGTSRDFFQDVYGKELKQIFCPHGNSDKGQAVGDLDIFKEPDCTLIYGQRMIDFLTHLDIYQGVLSPLITGNMRYSYYLHHKNFYDLLVQEEIFSKIDPKKKTIMYAPTWDQEGACFFKAYPYILDHIPDGYQVLVKLHPNMMEDYLGQMTYILGKYEKQKNILFLHDYPLVYPLLARVDFLITDMSSVGYDFLAFDRPMLFLNQYKENFFLHQCGDTLYPWQYDQIYQKVQDPTFMDKKRMQVYTYTFGKTIPFLDLQKELLKNVKDRFFCHR